jgi:hypothetical protein
MNDVGQVNAFVSLGRGRTGQITATGYQQQNKARGEDATADQKQFPFLIAALRVLNHRRTTRRESGLIFRHISRLSWSRLLLF